MADGPFRVARLLGEVRGSLEADECQHRENRRGEHTTEPFETFYTGLPGREHRERVVATGLDDEPQGKGGENNYLEEA